jgi:ribulose 1,5-bisphosphate synthetase/thiazole synthase
MRILSKAAKLCSLYRTGQHASYATSGGGALKSAGSPDVVIVGAGHNGLVAATLLAKQGMRVHVVEAKDVVGGACRTGGASSADWQWRQPPGS